MTLFKRLFGGGTEDGYEVRLFLETMLIMIAADGQVEDPEMKQVLALVRTRPELSHIPQRLVDKHMQEAFVAIRREGLEKRVQAIAKGLQIYCGSRATSPLPESTRSRAGTACRYCAGGSPGWWPASRSSVFRSGLAGCLRCSANW